MRRPWKPSWWVCSATSRCFNLFVNLISATFHLLSRSTMFGAWPWFGDEIERFVSENHHAFKCVHPRRTKNPVKSGCDRLALAWRYRARRGIINAWLAHFDWWDKPLNDDWSWFWSTSGRSRKSTGHRADLSWAVPVDSGILHHARVDFDLWEGEI